MRQIDRYIDYLNLLLSFTLNNMTIFHSKNLRKNVDEILRLRRMSYPNKSNIIKSPPLMLQKHK